VTPSDTPLRSVHRFALDSEAATARLAEAVAASTHAGEAILLEGDLGAGKTAFARAFLRAVADDHRLEVPSPTFTLLQTYDLPRLRVAHVDLYRLADPQELDELGLEDYARNGVIVAEWPERGAGRFGGDRLHLLLKADPAAPDTRLVTLTGEGGWAGRLDRLATVRAVLADLGYGDWHRRFLKGDASTRRYERLGKDSDKAVLMDSPALPDPGTGSAPYSRIAHLAESVTPFMAIAEALKARGLSTPEIYESDLGNGILVLEDLGTETVLDGDGRPVQDRYCAALDVLAALHQLNLPDHAEAAPGLLHRLPRYDLGAFLAEIELMPEWFAGLAAGAPLPETVLEAYQAHWRDLLFDLTDPDRHRAWVLRDYHSPNLMWLADREAHARVGILDIQDAVIGPAAYDVASLIFDARVDVPERMRRELYAYYIAERQIADPGFDAEAFDRDFAILAAQRITKILGIFARLYLRDGKPGYLAHIPRLSTYLEAALTHPVLAGLKSWYDTHLPHASRLGAAETPR